MDQITATELPDLFEQIGKVMSAYSERLCEMDAQMGDGDLGLTMKKGFCLMPQLLREAEAEPDMGKRLAKAGMRMASAVPSTMGTLMASGIMSGGKAVAGLPCLDAHGFSAYLNGFAEGLARRGKCAPGDRTVLDAIHPAAQSSVQALLSNSGVSLQEVARIALESAQSGVEATRNMAPKYGKAAVFASRASGVADQGAYAGMLMLLGCYEYITNKKRL